MGNHVQGKPRIQMDFVRAIKTNIYTSTTSVPATTCTTTTSHSAPTTGRINCREGMEEELSCSYSAVKSLVIALVWGFQENILEAILMRSQLGF
jgi:hypothetical protein